MTFPDWIGAHVRMFRSMVRAAPAVPDNLKSGSTSLVYDPECTAATRRWHARRRHLPARPKRPRDKAAVEAGVRFAQSYILGRLRNVTFFSLAECNAAIAAAVERMNGREMRRLGISRRQLFEAVELPLMRRCHRMISSMPSGISPASASTITSRSRGSSTRCRTP